MKYINFCRENDKFNDILTDPVLKKLIKTKIRWPKYLVIGIDKKEEQVLSYITLKYGDEMKSSLVKDFSPISGVDYVPKR